MQKDGWMWLIIIGLVALAILFSGTKCDDNCREQQAEDAYHERFFIGAP